MNNWTLGQAGANKTPKQTQYKAKQTQFQCSKMLNSAIYTANTSTGKSLQQPMQKFHWQPHHVCQAPLDSFDEFIPLL
jgi:hypothetical protein